MLHSASMSQIPVISDVGFDYSCLDCDTLVTWTNLSLSTTLRNVAGSRSTLTKTGTSIGEHIHTWNLGGLDAILINAIMQISVLFYCLVSSHLMMMLGLRWMLWNLYDDISILVQVMAWCALRQQMITRSKVDTSLCHHVMSISQNELTNWGLNKMATIFRQHFQMHFLYVSMCHIQYLLFGAIYMYWSSKICNTFLRGGGTYLHLRRAVTSICRRWGWGTKLPYYMYLVPYTDLGSQWYFGM